MCGFPKYFPSSVCRSTVSKDTLQNPNDTFKIAKIENRCALALRRRSRARRRRHLIHIHLVFHLPLWCGLSLRYRKKEGDVFQKTVCGLFSLSLKDILHVTVSQTKRRPLQYTKCPTSIPCVCHCKLCEFPETQSTTLWRRPTPPFGKL